LKISDTIEMLLFPNSSISVLQTSTAITVSARVQTIPLARDFLAGGFGTAIGWGQTSHPGSAPDILQFVDLTIIGNDQCAGQWGPIHININNAHICTFTRAGQGENYFRIIFYNSSAFQRAIMSIKWP
jgi:hypothetical protein